MDYTIYTFPFPSNLPYFEQPWTLDGVQYLFRLQWNTRQSLWYMTICDATSAAILSSIALYANRNLIGQYTTLALPKGLLCVMDNTGNGEAPGLNSFDTTHALVYVAQ